MRTFQDETGREWIASVARREGEDYKGAFHLVMAPADGGTSLSLSDVQWNNERTAERTLTTMSLVELRRRLRSARGRVAPV